MPQKKGSDNLAMAFQGTQYSDPNGSYSLSWPLGGEREVIAIPAGERDTALERRIVGGAIEEVDDAPNKGLEPTRASRTILTGQAAKDHMAEPPPDKIGFRSFRIHEPAVEATVETTEEEEAPARDADLEGQVTRKALDAIAAKESVDITEAKNKGDVITLITSSRDARDAEAAAAAEATEADETDEPEETPASGGATEDAGENG